MERSEVNLIYFTSQNYTTWAFQFELYLEAKELWGHVYGFYPKSTEDAKKIATWNTKDAKIKAWILGFVEPHLILNLKPYKTSKGMWDYLKKVQHQDNCAPRYHLECKIGNYAQGKLSIPDYYFFFRNLWVEYDGIKYADVTDAMLLVIQDL